MSACLFVACLFGRVWGWFEMCYFTIGGLQEYSRGSNFSYGCWNYPALPYLFFCLRWTLKFYSQSCSRQWNWWNDFFFPPWESDIISVLSRGVESTMVELNQLGLNNLTRLSWFLWNYFGLKGIDLAWWEMWYYLLSWVYPDLCLLWLPLSLLWMNWNCSSLHLNMQGSMQNVLPSTF